MSDMGEHSMKRLGWMVYVLVSLFAGSETVQAKYPIPPNLEEIPIERLMTNVQEKIAAEPSVVEWRYALARLYGIAYAGSKTPPAIKQTPGWPNADASHAGTPYFSPPDLTPWRPQKTPQSTPNVETQRYLTLATQAYQEALRLDSDSAKPQHLWLLMGLAWCYEENRQIDEAIATYRQAHELAWNRENALEGTFGGSITVEAGEALLRLLPVSGTAKERDAIQKHINAIKAKPLSVTPLLMPLTNMTSLEKLVHVGSDRNFSGVWFDLIGGGQPTYWEWITTKAGWLVWDPKQSGVVKDGRQLFGSTTWWVFWENGFQPLSLLDDNKDGWLTGAELTGLAIWHDRNGDGEVQDGEVQSLTSRGIVAVVCQPMGLQGNILYHPTGVRFSDGTQRPIYDWLPKELKAPTISLPQHLPGVPQPGELSGPNVSQPTPFPVTKPGRH